MLARLLALTLLLLSAPLDAGEDVWTPIGPEGGTVTALAFSVNGRTSYAGLPDGGVYKSINNGRSWTRTGHGLRGSVADLEADPTAAATVYAATSLGVFKTDDAGASWTDLTPRLPGLGASKSAWSLTTTPAEPGTVYASLYDPHVFDGTTTQARVYRSADRGASWRPAASGLPRTQPVRALAAHPRQRGVVFAGTTNGLFRSDDSGRTWVPSGLRRDNLVQVAFDPVQPERVYAVRMVPQHRFPPYPEVFVSNQGGRQGWRVVGESVVNGYGLPELVADPSTAGTAYISVSGVYDSAIYKTTDGGEHWTRILPLAAIQFGGVEALAINPRQPAVLLAGRSGATDRPVLRTVDGGASWAPSASGLRALPARQVVADPETPGTLYVLADCCSLWKTTDAGHTWRRLGDTALLGFFEGLAIDPAVPTTLYVSTASGMFKSLDGGETWSHLVNAYSAIELALDPAHPSTLYSVNERVRKSPDAGLTWQSLPAPEDREMTAVAIAPGAPSTVYTNGIFYVLAEAGRFDSVNRSPDGGATWTTIFSLGIKDGLVTDLLVHPRDPDRALASFGLYGGPTYTPVSGGVFRSTGSGGRWRRSSLGPENPPVFTLAQDPRDPARVYAGAPGAVFVSRDRGATWTSRSTGLAPGDVRDLEIDPFDPAALYAATDGGLYAITKTSND
jgi:photosystem II stability/assembly factor-like uncharacterized protein